MIEMLKRLLRKLNDAVLLTVCVIVVLCQAIPIPDKLAKENNLPCPFKRAIGFAVGILCFLIPVLLIGWAILAEQNDQVEAIDTFCTNNPNFTGEAVRIINQTDEETWVEVLIRTKEGRVSIIEINCTAWNSGEYVSI